MVVDARSSSLSNVTVSNMSHIHKKDLLAHVMGPMMVLLTKIEMYETCWPMMVILPGSPLKAEMCRFTH